MFVGDTVALPLVALVPVQPPEAVHDVASVLDQVSVELAPAVIVAGFAAKVAVAAAVGAGGAGGGSEVVTAAATTVIEVGSHDEIAEAESTAHTVKSYVPGTVAVPVRFPFGLTIMPSGGAPSSNAPDR